LLIAVVLFGVYSGLYPLFAWLTPLWIIGALGIGFFYFLVTTFLPPSKTGMVEEAAKRITSRIMKEARKRHMTTEEMVEELRREMAAQRDPLLQAELARAISELKKSEKHEG
jgi:hypothetical protein